MAERSGDEGFLARWARRKDEVRGAARELEPGPSRQQPASPPETAGDRAVPAPELPDVETLTLESDFAQFLREGVPLELRRRALRRLWRLDPVFANLDGLNDYDEDFGLLHKLGGAGGVRTAFRVGKGIGGASERAAEALGSRHETGTGEDRPAGAREAGSAADQAAGLPPEYGAASAPEAGDKADVASIGESQQDQPDAPEIDQEGNSSDGGPAARRVATRRRTGRWSAAVRRWGGFGT